MNRHKISAFAAGVSAAIFGILYPEYVLLPDTYEYIIMEKNGQVEIGEVMEDVYDQDSLEQLLSADPEQIMISSFFLEKLENKGLVLWKNMNWSNADMP